MRDIISEISEKESEHMKKIAVLLLSACLLLCFAGCDIADYTKAMNLYDDGQFADARDIFASLGDYGDSAAMAQAASQQADYQAAELYFSSGDYALALPLYQGLDMFMDSPVKAVACQYQLGLGCIEAGAYEEALTWLESLGNYEDSRQQVGLAKWLWLYTAVQTKGGSIETPVSGGAVSLTANEDGTMTLAYRKEATLLGMPYETSLSMVLQQGTREAQYAVRYVSTGINTIEEEAQGALDIALFSPTADLPVSSFSQRKTDSDGNESASTDPADAVMMRSVLMETQAALSEGLPALLAGVEAAVTVTDLGFAALQ